MATGTNNDGSSGARERVLREAERQFAERGYTGVTLRDIADALKIKQASLYYHVPGGKEQLFIEVAERTFTRHRLGLEHAMAEAGPEIRARLRAVATWLLSQPPMDLVRMTYSDMPTIDPVHARRLAWMAYDSMIGPIAAALTEAQQAGAIDHHNMGLIAGGLLGMIESLHAAPGDAEISRLNMAYELIDVMLYGLQARDRRSEA
jgi:AcrR family transcriptional regulator